MSGDPHGAHGLSPSPGTPGEGWGEGQFQRRRGRSVWAFVAFLALFFILLALVTKLYLLRALTDFNGSDDRGRKLISLHALLLMSLLLVILGLSLILLFRIGRYFFPTPRSPEPKTKYTDAWTEAGKRIKTPEE